jgi:uncharacterized protein
MALTAEEGAELVRLARDTVDAFVKGQTPASPPKEPPFMKEVRGAFVTLKKKDGELRGCIGLSYPTKPLGEAIVEAAIGAAGYDPRFSRVEPRELGAILVEVSALTKPEQLRYSSPLELPHLVKTGVDGLIVSNSYTSGLLLPQVATEYNMNSEDFLSHTCLKAGLRADAWLTKGLTIQKFQAEIFSEASPGSRPRAPSSRP